MSEDDGEISTITRDIVPKAYGRKDAEANYSDRVFTTYDYLERIEEPTPSELMQLENRYIGKDDWLFEEDGSLNNMLFDVSRSDYFDYVHADEPFTVFRKDMPMDEFTIFLSEQAPEDRWVYEMYRAVYQQLARMPSSNAGVLIQKYGLEDGRQRSQATIAGKFRNEYYSEHGYTWNVARVSKEIREGLSYLRWYSNLERFAEEIKRIFTS